MIPLFLSIAKQVGVNATLLLSICSVESNLRVVNNFKDSNGGSYGICMLNINTAREIEPYIDILALQQKSVNIRIAALYIKKLQNRYDKMEDVIVSYNAGSVRMYNDEYINRGYLDKVIESMEEYEHDHKYDAP